MKLGRYHIRKDGCWREVPQADPRRIVLRLLFEWPWHKKDPRLKK